MGGGGVMKRVPGSSVLTLWLLALPVICQAFELPAPEPFHNGLSLQGYTGIINTPSAYVTQEGFLDGFYSNQKESMWRDKTSYQDNYLFSLGVFRFAEIGGRLTNAPEVQVRDLSANIKLTSEALFSRYAYAPVLAVGYQDLTGGGELLQNKYAVISENIWRLRLSAGYGFGSRRMKGLFAGGEFKAHEWVYLLGEHDTAETNLGVRIITPQLWNIPVQLTAIAKTSLNHRPGNVDVGVGLTFPLDFQVRPAPSGYKQGSTMNKAEIISSTRSPAGPAAESNYGAASVYALPVDRHSAAPDVRTYVPPVPTKDPNPGLAKLRDRLIEAGFQNVRVGKQEGSTLVVEYENVTFNHNELDALGVVCGMAAEAGKDYFQFVRLIIKKKDIRMLQVSMPQHEMSSFIEYGSNIDELKDQVAVSRRIDDDTDVAYLAGNTNSSVLTAALVLWPGLTTFVGTEQGVFDYLLTIKPELLVNLWKGGVVNARWEVPVLWSDNLDDGKAFSNRRMSSRLDRLMLFQGVRLLPDIMANLGTGMVSPHVYGTLNELVWTPGTGEHSVRLMQSWGTEDKNSAAVETYLASYRYYFNRPELFLTATVGKFMSQDRGYAFEMKRMFGDTGASVYYKNSIALNDRHWQAAGIMFSFPLTLSRDMKHHYGMQLRGRDEWSYSQETVLTTGSQKTNDILEFPLAVTPMPTASLYNQYLNRDRLNKSYITNNLSRLHEAWVKFNNKNAALHD